VVFVIDAAYPLETLANGEFMFHLNLILNEIGYFNAKGFNEVRNGIATTHRLICGLLKLQAQYSLRKGDFDIRNK